MRYRLMATYRGMPYEAGLGPTDGDVVLFAACPPPEDLDFEPATGHWRKLVGRAEVALWESRPTGTFGGEPCLVLDDLGDRLHISYLGDDPYRATRLGYHQVEPAVFEVVTAREAVTGLTEERVAHPLPWRPAAQGQPARQAPPEPLPPGPLSDPPPGPLDGSRPGPLGDSLPSPLGGPLLAPPGLAAEAPYARPAPPVALPPAVAMTQPGTLPPVAGLPPVPPLPSCADPLPAAALPSRADLPPVAGPSPAAPARSRRGRGAARPHRAQTRWIFSELASLAAMPQAAYAVDEEVDGAICLLSTDHGFEVFTASDGARHEMRVFEDEEAAYFYMFGLLAAEAVRDGRLVPRPG